MATNSRSLSSSDARNTFAQSPNPLIPIRIAMTSGPSSKNWPGPINRPEMMLIVSRPPWALSSQTEAASCAGSAKFYRHLNRIPDTSRCGVCGPVACAPSLGSVGFVDFGARRFLLRGDFGEDPAILRTDHAGVGGGPDSLEAPGGACPIHNRGGALSCPRIRDQPPRTPQRRQQENDRDGTATSIPVRPCRPWHFRTFGSRSPGRRKGRPRRFTILLGSRDGAGVGRGG